MDIARLKNWFILKKRDLPWRQNCDPYAIWISEVMLQQTQVVVVIPYFLNWMERFPTIHHLAQASNDEVIKAWEGLGYYSRVRHLHQASKLIVNSFNGEIPSTEEELIKIKGMGPYTIGAILSFAFHQKKAAVDGNVIRVLTRYLGIEEDVSKSLTIKKLRGIAQEILPDEEPWVINEALIELGATICQRKALCGKCPLSNSCSSFLNSIVGRIPFNSKKVKIERLSRSVAVIQCGPKLLVRRGQKGEIMQDLYEFPYFDIQKPFSPKELEDQFFAQFALEIKHRHALTEVQHGFTRYQVKLFPMLSSSQESKEIDGMEWHSHSDLKRLAFSSGHRRIFQQLDDLLLPV